MEEKITKNIEERIGYSFKDKNLVEQAFTHKSSNSDQNYERLEFLGDAIMGAAVSEHLFLAFGKLTEGELSRARAVIVNMENLFDIACRLGIQKFIITEGIEEKNRRIIANVYESLIGAIFLDSSYEETKKILTNHLDLSKFSPGFKKEFLKYKDYKSDLQELIQKKFNSVPEYTTLKKEGPDHRSVFTVCVKLNNKTLGLGTGLSKKIAEQQAAENALKHYKNEK